MERGQENNVRNYVEPTEEVAKLAALAQKNDVIDSELYQKYNVKRGLRDLNGRGVLAGLTHVSEVRATKVVDGETVPDYGKLIYRGYDIKQLVKGFFSEGRFGFEETAYLLMFGKLPTHTELIDFAKQMIAYRQLPPGFVRDVIMKAPSEDMMNTLSRSVLTLYAYDKYADDTSLPNVVMQCMKLISRAPMLAVYGYYTDQYYNEDKSLFVVQPMDHGSFAENLLHLLRPDGQYSKVEALALDAALVLHMDHGGGNNSTFTTHVVTSTMTDTYSAMGAALGSLKGPRHGGANIKVVHMFDDLKQQVSDWTDDEEIEHYLGALLHKEAFDRAGLIYGVGHAVYSKSDPRAEIFKWFVKNLATEKGCLDEYDLYDRVERLAPQVISRERKMYKGVCANVDFYSGFAYRMLGLPEELFTPMFAMARMVGWSAHRIEELANNSKIIRPGYKCIEPDQEYIPMVDRNE